MGTRFASRCIGLLVCGLLMTACQTRPMVHLMSKDVLTYRATASPLEHMRLQTPPGQIDLDIHADGWAHLRNSTPKGLMKADVLLSHEEIEIFFTDMMDAGIATMGKYPELSKEPLANHGELAPSCRLTAQINGKTYEYYWLSGDFPPGAEVTRQPIFKLIQRLEPLAHLEE